MSMKFKETRADKQATVIARTYLLALAIIVLCLLAF